jgi:hypothetical protein
VTSSEGSFSTLGQSPPTDGSNIVNGNILASISLTVPANVDPWNLTVGNNNVSGNMTVKANTPWQVQVSDQGGLGGKMTKWIPSSGYDITKALANQLTIGAQLGSGQGQVQNSVNLNGQAQTIALGTIDGQSGNDGQTLSVTFGQTVLYSDPILTGGYSYHIVITYVASPTI